MQPEPPANHYDGRPAAAVGRRAGAGLLDLLALGVLFVVIAAISGGGHHANGKYSVHTGTGGTVVYLALVLAYYFFTESRLGATPGKRLLGLRVVTAEGGVPTSRQIAQRTILRIVDGLPFLYLVGFVTILATGESATRVGDIVAKTTVVMGPT